MSIKPELKGFVRGFKFAFTGILHCIKNERNMRFHFCAAFYVLIFMNFYDLSRAETAAVYLTIGAVISLEALNTAVEAVVDLVSPEHRRLAGIAKDCASGAVLIAAVVSVAVGTVLFWDIETFKSIGKYFAEHIPMLILLIISVIVWFLVIFVPQGKGKDNEKE